MIWLFHEGYTGEQLQVSKPQRYLPEIGASWECWLMPGMADIGR